MGDFLSQVHRELAEFGKQYVDEIMQELTTPEIKSTLEVDVGFIMLTRDVEENAVVSARVFIECIATQIVHSQNFGKQAIPTYDKKALTVKCHQNEIPVDFMGSFILRLTRPGTKLPLLGEIAVDGELIPNKAAIEQWASFFDWN